jgi:hypothetical protein
MMAEILGGTIFYTSTAGDWLAFLKANNDKISIEFNSNTNSMEMSSGINYDNLVTFIGEVKADAISRGVNWNGN